MLGDYREVRSGVDYFYTPKLVKNMSLTTLTRLRQSRMIPSFDSQTKAKQFAFLVAQYAKIPGRGFCFWATTGNRTRISGTTNRRNDRYTIVAIYSDLVIECAYLYLFLKEKSSIIKSNMDDEARKLATLILFILGAGVGFYLARFFF